jgi:hypothetical protein
MAMHSVRGLWGPLATGKGVLGLLNLQLYRCGVENQLNPLPRIPLAAQSLHTLNCSGLGAPDGGSNLSGARMLIDPSLGFSQQVTSETTALASARSTAVAIANTHHGFPW